MLPLLVFLTLSIASPALSSPLVSLQPPIPLNQPTPDLAFPGNLQPVAQTPALGAQGVAIFPLQQPAVAAPLAPPPAPAAPLVAGEEAKPPVPCPKAVAVAVQTRAAAAESSIAALADGRMHPVKTKLIAAELATLSTVAGSVPTKAAFDKVPVNYGSTMEGSAFVATIPGFYLFTVSMEKPAGSAVTLTLFKNDNDLAARAFAGKDEVGSVSAFAEIWLNAGDRVEAEAKSPTAAALTNVRMTARLLVATSVPFPVVCAPANCPDEDCLITADK